MNAYLLLSFLFYRYLWYGLLRCHEATRFLHHSTPTKKGKDWSSTQVDWNWHHEVVPSQIRWYHPPRKINLYQRNLRFNDIYVFSLLDRLKYGRIQVYERNLAQKAIGNDALFATGTFEMIFFHTNHYLKIFVTKLWFRFVSGNTETWTPSTGLQDQLVLKRHDDWDTRPLKVSSFTGIG